MIYAEVIVSRDKRMHYRSSLWELSHYVSLLRAFEESREHMNMGKIVPSDSFISIVAISINVAFTLENVYRSL